MTYQLPEPAIHAPFYKEYKTVYQGDYFTADQMQQAYAAGRESMRVECVRVCDKWIKAAKDDTTAVGIALAQQEIEELK